MEIRATSRKIRFGHCTLDEGRGVLVAPDGSETVLRPKTFELLKLLLGNAGRVVARAEILDAVWPGIFVTDDSITQCVVELRKAMGAAGAELLRTMPRRGYLLQAEVMAEAPPPATAAMLSPRMDDRPSIAVLPFRKDHVDPREAYFCDGIIEGIVHVLSGLDGLFVVSRGSALAFAQVTTDARAAGRELGVRYVLYGGVRRAGTRLRISTELTDAERGTILRADRYDGEEGDLFELQDRIAEQVAAQVMPQLRHEEFARALRKPPASLSAYDLVLRALDLMQRLERAAMSEAELLLRQATDADPDLALARTYTAWLHVLRIAQGWSGDVAADSDAAARAAAAAMERDRKDALAMAIRGHTIGYVARDFDGGLALIQRAVALSPSCALAWTFGAAIHCWRDDPTPALAWAERAMRLAPYDPFAFYYQHVLAQAHYTVGDFARAVEWGRRSAQANPGHAASWRVLAASLVAADRLEEAASAARMIIDLDPGFALHAYAARTPLAGATRDIFIERLRRAGLPG